MIEETIIDSRAGLHSKIGFFTSAIQWTSRSSDQKEMLAGWPSKHVCAQRSTACLHKKRTKQRSSAHSVTLLAGFTVMTPLSNPGPTPLRIPQASRRRFIICRTPWID